jgi:conjugal transfer pilus assembly protein TraU
MKLHTKILAFLVGILVLVNLSSIAMAEEASIDVNPMCKDANVLSNVFTQVCWDCFIDSINLMGMSSGNAPAGAASVGPFCMCSDNLGVPYAGIPKAHWQPTRLNEVVTTPWCSPSLGGIKLQDTLTGLGYNNTEEDNPTAFYQYHYFAYPIMTMLDMLVMPSCGDGYVDFDLMYLSEVDPLWNDDLMSLMLNPEAIVFGNPAAIAWCITDCVLTTADMQQEEFYGCAGCDGLLYPLTGNINPQPDPVAGSSLITQRVLASLHRKGLAKKTIGEDAMCKPEYFPTIPRSQYRFSMLYPVPEASSEPVSIVNPSTDGTNAGSAGGEQEVYDQCCHPMGMSTSRWCTPTGGRTRPGMDSAYVYLIWNYRDCCIISSGE